jgi:hypothetical protein
MLFEEIHALRHLAGNLFGTIAFQTQLIDANQATRAL